ncbi:MAG: glycosyltransferase, partial [Syntrophothermus sp.]
KGEALLMNGNFSEGWKEYEWRTGRKDFGLRKFNKPLPANTDLTGRRVLVYAEQGIGDALQFARYLPMLKELGAYIIFECDKAIIGLMRSIKEIDELIERNLAEAPDIKYDYDIPLLSLPLYFNTTIENVPAQVPYLFPDDESAEKWKRLIPSSDKLKIGIVWAGSPTHSNDRHRSVRLKQFLSLFSIPDTEFYSLQKGFPVIQLRDYQLFVRNLDDYINSFSDTAAAINQLDLVIAVDTSVAHMAGALGKNIWLLTPYVPDWRWMLDREDSPWYPSMKLYRQPEVFNWNAAFAKIKSDLIKYVGSRKNNMNTCRRSFGRLENFLNKIEKKQNSRNANLISEIFLKQISAVLEANSPFSKTQEALHIDCGNGEFMRMMSEKGIKATGISLKETEVNECQKMGHDAYTMDQSFMDFDENRFDLLISINSLGHSFSPAFTITEYFRVLKEEGLAFIGITSIEKNADAAGKTTNSPLFDMLPMEFWKSAVLDSGFLIENITDYPAFADGDSGKIFLGFICRKPKSDIRNQFNQQHLTLALTSGENFGWGVCSKYLKKELPAFIDFEDVENLNNQQKSKVVKGKVLHALTNNEFFPLHNIRGDINYGYTFFESELTDVSVENARKYECVIGGSTYNRDKMLEKNITNCNYLIQGIDPEIFYPGESVKSSDLFIIFSGGKFEYRKGQDLVLKAVQILQKKYADIILINAWYNLWPETMDSMSLSKHINYERKGENWQQFMVNLLKINDIDGNKVFTLPLTPNDKMREIYLRSDLGLFPNRCEGGTNLVLMEYMACGKPVVASYNTGHKDILTRENSLMLEKMSSIQICDDQNKLISEWEEADLDEMIAKIEYAYLNRDVIKKIGNKAGEDLKKYTWKETARNLLKIMEL